MSPRGRRFRPDNFSWNSSRNEGYREVKVMTIGGGAEEIMKDLAARQMGW